MVNFDDKFSSIGYCALPECDGSAMPVSRST